MENTPTNSDVPSTNLSHPKEFSREKKGRLEWFPLKACIEAVYPKHNPCTLACATRRKCIEHVHLSVEWLWFIPSFPTQNLYVMRNSSKATIDFSEWVSEWGLRLKRRIMLINSLMEFPLTSSKSFSWKMCQTTWIISNPSHPPHSPHICRAFYYLQQGLGNLHLLRSRHSLWLGRLP